MKKTLFTNLLLLGYAGVYAQDQVTIKTEYDDPSKNKWNGGIYAGLDVQNNSGGLFFGINGRYTLGKIATFSTNVALDMTTFIKSGGFISYDEQVLEKLPSYKSIELRGAFHFSDKEKELKSTIKLGQDATHKYSTGYTTKVRNVLGITASLNIQSRSMQQIKDSVVIITVENPPNANGYVPKLSMGQNNVMLGVGLQMGQYTWFKGKFTAGPIGTKTRRVRKSIVSNIEFLYGMTIGTKDEAFVKDDNGNLITYKVKDVEKKRLGFRISADYSKNKPGFFSRMEIGYRPGIMAPSKQDSKFLNQGYIVYGAGIAF